MWRMRSRSWAAARTEPALVTVDGCHPPSSELVLQEDDPWSSTPAQEVSIPDGFVVSGTVLRGSVIAAPLPAALAAAASGDAGEARVARGRSAPAEAEALSSCHASLGPSAHDEGRAPRRAAARKRLVPSAGESMLGGSLRDTAGAAAARQSLLLGPDAQGRWSRVSVQSIKYKDLSVARAEAGQSGSFWVQADSRPPRCAGYLTRPLCTCTHGMGLHAHARARARVHRCTRPIPRCAGA
eukprot:scaffold95675_cov54-Phaeocystis_antarctica.AAC.1